MADKKKKVDKKTFFHYLFEGGIAIKGINAIIEIIAGLILLLAGQELIANIVGRIFRSELLHDPADFIVTQLLNTAVNASISTQMFLAIYLLAHGFIKLVIVSLLLYNRKWVYPVAAVLLSIICAYQIFKVFTRHSFFFIFLTLLDLTILLLLHSEYNRLIEREKKQKKRK